MSQTPNASLPPPRLENRGAFLIAGLGQRFTWENSAGIPALWQRFQAYEGAVPGQVGRVAYGACCNADDAGSFEYIAGVEVADFAPVPAEFSRLRIAQQRYAVFTHSEHLAKIRDTLSAIWNEWLPRSGYQMADAPNFERYDERFDARTGRGGFEIWIPIKA